MQVARPIVEFGINVAPVPGLKPAFILLTAIWDNVQLAATNKKELKNLAGSAEDILASVNLVLSRKKSDGHIWALLEKLNKVMEDFLQFTKNHVNMNVFKALIRNVDAAGEIQSFQRRLQNILMAFIVAAFGAFDSAYDTIQSKLHELISRGQPRVIERDATRRHAPQSPLVPRSTLRAPSLSSSINATETTHHDTECSKSFVRASFSKPFIIEVRNGGPIMSTRHYEPDIDFSQAGLGAPDSIVTRTGDSFRILRATDSKISNWTLSGRVVSLVVQDPDRSDWDESLDIVFPGSPSAEEWFSWLQAYASTRSLGLLRSHPRAKDVIVRKQYHCWIQKTPTEVVRRRPGSKEWGSICRGHAQSARSHPSHFVYVTPGVLSFSMVYRSGDTIVREHFVHANDEEPTTTSRIHFSNEQEAQAWYSVGVSTLYSGTLLISNEAAIIASPVWPPVDLTKWGIINSKSSVTHTPDEMKIANVTTSWAWFIRGNRITIQARIVSQPGWFDDIEIEFPDAKSSRTWFRYFAQMRGTDDSGASLLPRSETISFKRNGICWMDKRKKTIMTRTAMSTHWRPIITSANRVEVRESHVVLESSSVLPYMRVSRSGDALVLTRQTSGSDSRCSVTRQYRFGSEEEVEQWYQAIKHILPQSSS